MKRKITEIKEPPFFDEENSRGCLVKIDGTLTYFINRHARQGLLWGFYHNFATFSFYEDPHLINDFFPALTARENWVPYCETTIIKKSDVPRRHQEYPQGYRASPDRLDFYVTKPEFVHAFFALKALGRKTRTKSRTAETQIFGVLRVVLLSDAVFL